MLSLTILSLLSLLPYALSHGFQSWPRQRGLTNASPQLPALNTSAPIDYCPHCLNGGGPGLIKENNNGKWTPYEPTDPSFPFRNDHGLCGDPKGINDHMKGGKYTTGQTIATYPVGGYIDFEVHVSAHHNGYFEFFMCNLDACEDEDISQTCFEKGHCYKLQRVKEDSCESGKDRFCGPVDPEYPGRWYLPPRNEKEPENNWYGGRNNKMKYVLPKDVECEQCVFHWSWVTANTCNPPGYVDYNFPIAWNGIPGDGGSVGGVNKGLTECGNEAVPEEFWSCAENVRVTRNGQFSRQVFHDGDMGIEPPGKRHRPEDMPMESMEPSVPDPAITPTPQAMPSPQATSKPEGSKFDLTKYVSSFDTGVCVGGERRFCEACLDLGYGTRKCLWCRRKEEGEECLHTKP